MAGIELAGQIDDLMILTADTSTSAGLERFRKTYPDKFLDVGIAEQNLMGIAAGLASEGMKVFTATFAPFQTMRCCEQIKMNLGYMRHNVCMVGLGSGVILGPLGYSHCCIEDVAMMRSIPGITVVSPADCCETFKVVVAAARHHESVYIRLTGGPGNPPVYREDYDFHIGVAKTLRDGEDVTIIAAGTMVHSSLHAAEMLSQEGLSVAVINMHTIKPIDTTAIDKACRSSRLIVTIEEHSVIGGLGSAVAEYKTTLKNAPPQLVVGLSDCYGKAGDYSVLLEQNELTSPQIAHSILERYAAVK